MAQKSKPVEVKEEVVSRDEKPKQSKKSTSYFLNKHYSALTILIRGGKDDLGQEGVVDRVRFVPYYDVFKGDTVRVGYLATDSPEVVKRCQEDITCVEISEKEYNQAVKGDDKNPPLRKAPIQQV